VREKLHEQLMWALQTLQAGYAEQGRWGELAAAARRQLALVPWTESAHRALMQALAAQGQVQLALAQFERCREILQKELGVEPSLATGEFVARLRRGDGAALGRQHNLTQPLKAFVGREGESGRLQALVRSERLVTVLGIGGVGKSHLAQTVAQKALPDFAHGVWFVPLANVEAGATAAERIALAIAAAVDYPITNMQAPLSELVGHLRTRQMLLVLDNCEHLVEAVVTVLFALLKNTGVHLLATSQVRLMAEGEILVQLEGLSPAQAFGLFVDRAQRVLPAFNATGNGDPGSQTIVAAINRICEQVAGLPLGIELAASWVEHYAVAEIAQSIAEIAVQPQRADGLVSRHHKLSSTFEYSWQLLSPHQQRILARLSLFRGGFDRVAAAAVAESALSDLSTLISYSLLQRVDAGRYDLHPLIREFAAQKLAAEPDDALNARYSRHYLTALVAMEGETRAPHHLLDFENICSAWQRAVADGDGALIEQAATSFGGCVAQYGLMSDGNKLFADAVERFGKSPEHQALSAQLLDRQSYFVQALHGLQAASVLQHRVLALTDNRALLVRTHIKLANYYAEFGAWAQSDFHSDQAEFLATESSDLGMYIRTVDGRIRINALHFRGDFAKGITRLEEMLHLLDTTSPPLADQEELRGELLSSLTRIAIRYGDYALSIHCGKRNLARTMQIGHQEHRTWILSDLALAELNAGLYPEAIAHLHEALALAGEIGSSDDKGILQVNLCLALRQYGQFEQALAAGVEANEILHALGHARLEGQARNRVGHTLLALERWGDAYAEYGEALVIWQPLQHPNRFEAVAGRAVAALCLGNQAEALALVEDVLDFVTNRGVVGIVEPVGLLLNCETVLTALGERARAAYALGQAGHWVQTIAGRISDDAVRAAFLHNRPDNQRLSARSAALNA
jgi:predicted ATPase